MDSDSPPAHHHGVSGSSYLHTIPEGSSDVGGHTSSSTSRAFFDPSSMAMGSPSNQSTGSNSSSNSSSFTAMMKRIKGSTAATSGSGGSRSPVPAAPPSVASSTRAVEAGHGGRSDIYDGTGPATGTTTNTTTTSPAGAAGAAGGDNNSSTVGQVPAGSTTSSTSNKQPSRGSSSRRSTSLTRGVAANRKKVGVVCVLAGVLVLAVIVAMVFIVRNIEHSQNPSSNGSASNGVSSQNGNATQDQEEENWFTPTDMDEPENNDTTAMQDPIQPLTTPPSSDATETTVIGGEEREDDESDMFVEEMEDDDIPPSEDALLVKLDEAMVQLYTSEFSEWTLPVMSSEVFNNAESPRYQARQWLLNNDTYFTTYASDELTLERITQRYIMTVFYFATYNSNTNTSTTGVDDFFQKEQDDQGGKTNSSNSVRDDTNNAVDFFQRRELRMKKHALRRISSSTYRHHHHHHHHHHDHDHDHNHTHYHHHHHHLQKNLQQVVAYPNTYRRNLYEKKRSDKYFNSFQIDNTKHECYWIENACGQNDDNQGTSSSSTTSSTTPTLDPDAEIIYLNASHSNLAGTLPFELGYLTSLRELTLHGNDLQGTLPESLLLQWQRLYVLDLSRNNLQGTIPATLWTLSILRFCYLHGNRFTGTIPQTLSDLPSDDLEEIWLLDNQLSGQIPNWWTTDLPSLDILSVRNNSWTGPLPEDWSAATNLEFVDISINQLTGTIPESLLYDVPSLRFLYLDYNELSGALPMRNDFVPDRQRRQLRQLSSGQENNHGDNNNHLSSLWQLRSTLKLEALWLQYNDLQGIIPEGFGWEWSRLRELELQGNLLTGQWECMEYENEDEEEEFDYNFWPKLEELSVDCRSTSNNRTGVDMRFCPACCIICW